MPSSSFAQACEQTHSVFEATIPAGALSLRARLITPAAPGGWVIIGYSQQYRHFAMPANPFGRAGLATMHLQLLPPQETLPRFDSDTATQMAQRLFFAIRWLRAEVDTASGPIGLFGAYQDAGVALSAAALLGSEVGAIVSWQGRPDRSMNHLSDITAPTLLLANERDEAVFAANVQARWWLRCTQQLALVPGRLRLLRERSSFQMVNQLAGNWYRQHLLGRQPLKSFPSQLLTVANSHEWGSAVRH